MRGAAGFQHSAMNRAGLEVLGQVFRSLFKPSSPSDSAGRSHLQHNGLQPHNPRGKFTFRNPSRGWLEIPQHCWHLLPPPSVRDKRLEAELIHNYYSNHPELCA